MQLSDRVRRNGSVGSVPARDIDADRHQRACGTFGVRNVEHAAVDTSVDNAANIAYYLSPHSSDCARVFGDKSSKLIVRYAHEGAVLGIPTA